MIIRHWQNRCEKPEVQYRQDSTLPVWLTSEQLAARLQVSVRTIAYWTSDGILPSYKNDRLVRYDSKECLESLKAFRRKSQFENLNNPE